MPAKTPPFDSLLFKRQFDELHREHLLILDRIEDLKKQTLLILDRIGQLNTTVSPELEAAIKTVACSAKAIDYQVPDFFGT